MNKTQSHFISVVCLSRSFTFFFLDLIKRRLCEGMILFKMVIIVTAVLLVAYGSQKRLRIRWRQSQSTMDVAASRIHHVRTRNESSFQTKGKNYALGASSNELLGVQPEKETNLIHSHAKITAGTINASSKNLTTRQPSFVPTAVPSVHVNQTDGPPISIVCQLAGEMGNQLSRYAYALGLQLELGSQMPSAIILRHQERGSKWLVAKKDLQTCFSFFRMLNFSQANSALYEERKRQQAALWRHVPDVNVPYNTTLLKDILLQYQSLREEQLRRGTVYDEISIPYIFAQSFVAPTYVYKFVFLRLRIMNLKARVGRSFRLERLTKRRLFTNAQILGLCRQIL
jgi:hypothetical protein